MTQRPKIKLVFCLRRREGLSREEFQSYWRERHAPLVASVAEHLGIRRYVQLHTVDHTDALRHARGAPEEFDGVAELWFDSTEALAVTTPEARAAAKSLLEDEARFIDLGRSPIFLTRERTILDE